MGRHHKQFSPLFQKLCSLPTGSERELENPFLGQAAIQQKCRVGRILRLLLPGAAGVLYAGGVSAISPG